MTNLSGKTALVTGASRGIGRASALALAREGAQVLVHYGRAAAEAEAVVKTIRDAGGRAEALAADLATADGPHKLAKDVRAIVGDRLDILVANAGISKAAKIEDTSIADFDNLFAVNVRAPYFLVQQLLPILGQGGSVIFVSSVVAHAVVGQLSAYAATKGAVDTLVKYFAAALGETRHPRQCGGARRRRYGYVELHQDGGRPQYGHEPAGPEAHRKGGRHCRRRRLPRLGRGTLDHRRHDPRRWRLEAVSCLRQTKTPKHPFITANQIS